MGKRDKKKKGKDPERKALQRAAKEAKADKKAAKRLAKEDARERGEEYVPPSASAATASSDTPKSGSKREKKSKSSKSKADGGDAAASADNDDIDAILASYAERNDTRLTSPVVEALEGPWPSPPRGNFTLTAVPGGGELILYGGECYDGVENVVFDEVLRWDPDGRRDGDDDKDEKEDEDNEDDNEDGDGVGNGGDRDGPDDASKAGLWRRILSPPPTPPARCSHSSVYHNGSLYVFGGELATSDRYHHYRDLWRFDLKSNRWEEILPRGSSRPPARSGHRTLVWRHYLILFGGFYEALRETRWYDDLWTYDFQLNMWTEMTYSKLATRPPGRSAFNFGLCPGGGDTAYLYGGFSKLKNPTPGSKQEGRVHTDCWALHLRNIANGKTPAWDRVGRRGEYPSPRSGTSCLTHKNRMLVFGGVQDTEGDHHAVRSVFYDDLFAFDMDRRRWFRMGMKKAGAGSGGGGRRRKKKGAVEAANTAAAASRDAPEDEEGSSSEDDMEAHPEGEAASSGWDLDKLKSNMFAFIDGEGNIVYEKIEEDEEEEKKEGEVKEEGEDDGYEADKEKGDEGEKEDEKDEEKGASEGEDQKKGDEVAETEPALEQEQEQEQEVPVKDSPADAKPPAMPPAALASASVLPPSPDPSARSSPLPRIHPSLAVRSGVLYVMGGLVEVGDREVTLDDCWALDLNKRERWECVWGGSMHRQVWRGVASDEEGSYVSSATGGGMDDDDDDDEDDYDSDERDDRAAGEGEEEEELMDPEEVARRRAERKAARKAAKKEKRAGAREEIARLREKYGLDDADAAERTPQRGEAVADFYGRTRRYWEVKAAETISAAGEALKAEGDTAAGDTPPASAASGDAAAASAAPASSPSPPLRSQSSNLDDLSAKELKREGFNLARARYDELRPALERLAELEGQREEGEGGGGGSGKGGGEKKSKKDKSKDKDRKKEKKEKKRDRRK